MQWSVTFLTKTDQTITELFSSDPQANGFTADLKAAELRALAMGWTIIEVLQIKDV